MNRLHVTIRPGSLRRYGGLLTTWAIATIVAGGASAALPDRYAVIAEAARSGETLWQEIATEAPHPTMEIRSLFFYAQALCEARQHPERLQRLFELAAQAQDRDLGSPRYGNLKWAWGDHGVVDRNSVEFSVKHAASIWLKHGEWMPEPAASILRDLLDFSIEGCLRHRVEPSYTNIAVFNAGNLIVLGEMLGRSAVAEEGYRRLDAVFLWTWMYGTHEYCSPNYYCPDLNGLLFIKAHAERRHVRYQAAALLELLWTDIALNWFPPAESLAGAHSRSHEFLSGIGSLDRHMWINGWLRGELRIKTRMVFPALGQGVAKPGLRRMSLDRLPRLVRQSWGPKLTESRTHMMYPDVTLSCAAASYGPMDMPLTVDLPGDRKLVRCYFIADGREDPYGTNKYERGKARRRKVRHLEPFWAAAQRTRDAVALVIYREQDVKEDVLTNLQSHIVLRRDLDGLWLCGHSVVVPEGTAEKPGRLPVGQGDPLVMRYGSAAVGIRLLWARSQEGKRGAAALVNDGNTHGAMRLTIDHYHDSPSSEAGAAFWVRVGTDLDDPSEFEQWRKRFERAVPSRVEASQRGVSFEVPGEDGVVSVAARAPYGLGGGVTLAPLPTRGVLELDGREIGKPLLDSIEPIPSSRNIIRSIRPLDVPAGADAYWEAESGLLSPAMNVAEDAKASGGRCLAEPPGPRLAHSTGSATWPLHVVEAGRYYLWARVFAPTPVSNSFYVRMTSDTDELLPETLWKIPCENDWCWQRVSVQKAENLVPLSLPAGLCRVHIRVRETGTRIDQLFLTADPSGRPR